MNNHGSRNLGFNEDRLSSGGLLSDSHGLKTRAQQEIELSICAVFVAEYSDDDSLMFKLLDIGVVNEYMTVYIKKRLSGAKRGSILNPPKLGREANHKPNKIHFSWYLMVRHTQLLNNVTQGRALKLIADTQLKTISPETISSAIKRIKKKIISAFGEEPDLDLVIHWCKITKTIIAPKNLKKP